jgi:hypothetical protein
VFSCVPNQERNLRIKPTIMQEEHLITSVAGREYLKLLLGPGLPKRKEKGGALFPISQKKKKIDFIPLNPSYWFAYVVSELLTTELFGYFCLKG